MKLKALKNPFKPLSANAYKGIAMATKFTFD